MNLGSRAALLYQGHASRDLLCLSIFNYQRCAYPLLPVVRSSHRGMPMTSARLRCNATPDGNVR
jgi:hypothetical protein